MMMQCAAMVTWLHSGVAAVVGRLAYVNHRARTYFYLIQSTHVRLLHIASHPQLTTEHSARRQVRPLSVMHQRSCNSADNITKSLMAETHGCHLSLRNSHMGLRSIHTSA